MGSGGELSLTSVAAITSWHALPARSFDNASQANLQSPDLQCMTNDVDGSTRLRNSGGMICKYRHLCTLPTSLKKVHKRDSILHRITSSQKIFIFIVPATNIYLSQINHHQKLSTMAPKILVILTSHDKLGETGKPTGWYLVRYLNALPPQYNLITDC